MTRIKDTANTTTQPAADDYAALDGATEGSRKMLGNLFYMGKILHVQHTEGQGVSAGGHSSGADVIRKLNTTVLNEITGASLGSDQITLPAGTFFITARVPFYATQRSRAWLYNVTDAGNILVGTSIYTASGGASTESIIQGKFTLAASKVLEIRSRVAATNGTNGSGVESNLIGDEIYTEVVIERLA